MTTKETTFEEDDDKDEGFDNGCKVELYVEHHGYDVIVEGVTPIAVVVDEELDDEIKMEDISEFVGSQQVGEDDVVIPNIELNYSFLSKLVDDSSVDDKFKVKEGFSYLVHNPNLPWNHMTSLLGMKFEHLDQLNNCLINYEVANEYQLWYKRNDSRSISVLCRRNVKEGRCASHKGKQKVDEDIAMKYGWRASCRRVIGLDVYFLNAICRVAAYSFLNLDVVIELSVNKVCQSTTTTPKKRTMRGRPRKNMIKHVTENVNELSRADESTYPNIVPNVANPRTVPNVADPSVSYPNVADPISNQSFTGLLNIMEQHDDEITALADIRKAEERAARRKDVERVLEDAKMIGVYSNRRANGFRGPSEWIRNQKRKKEDPNCPGKQPDLTLDA
ncbi:hypothetical protein Tco_1499639 [Tanacetum coccineum]